MYLFYSFVLSLLFLALLPYFIYQAARHGKYAGGFKERMGRLPESVRGDGRKTIWVHAVSVGEFLAATPLIKRLRSDLPAARIVVSTTTLTGQQLARRRADLFDAVFYFPFDWKFSVRRSLARVNPSAVIILETELWPNFLRECRKRGVSVVLANGRISARSFRRYQRVARSLKRAIEDFSLMIMQSEADADRARQLGAPGGLVHVCGNLKYDSSGDGGWGSGAEEGAGEPNWKSSPQPPTPNPYPDIDQQFSLSLSPHLIVAGSTAPGEEEMLLASLREVRGHSGLRDARLLLAPRHPERFNEVASLLGRSGFLIARRSESRAFLPSTVQRSGGNDADLREEARGEIPDVILLDTIGELASVYRFAAVVFVGGSLVPFGGHNIIEPAAFAKPIIVGPHTENFRQIVSDFVRADAVVQIERVGEAAAHSLARDLIGLLSDRERARAIGERARDILLENRGATDCTVALIKEVMKVVRGQ